MWTAFFHWIYMPLSIPDLGPKLISVITYVRENLLWAIWLSNKNTVMRVLKIY